MTWPEYYVLLISKYEQEQAAPTNSDPERGNVIRCDSFEDFAAVLAGTRGRIE